MGQGSQGEALVGSCCAVPGGRRVIPLALLSSPKSTGDLTMGMSVPPTCSLPSPPSPPPTPLRRRSTSTTGRRSTASSAAGTTRASPTTAATTCSSRTYVPLPATNSSAKRRRSPGQTVAAINASARLPRPPRVRNHKWFHTKNPPRLWPRRSCQMLQYCLTVVV